jgi:RNA polymerase sigma-70 factor (ECF subfamily)
MAHTDAPDPPHDPAAGERWVLAALERYERPLLRYAASLLHDTDRARDVVQEAFLRLCREQRSALDIRLPQWLFTVCRNLAIDVKRARPLERLPDPALADDRDVAGALAALEQQTLLGEILRIVDTLPVNQREVVYLRFLGGLSYREISQTTGLSVGNVGFLIHTAMASVRRRVDAAAPRSAATEKP